MYVSPYQPIPRGRSAPVVYRRGMGDMTRTNLAKSSGALVGSSIMALSPLAGPAAPFVALAGLAVTGLSNLFATVFSGCGQTCVQASQLVDKVFTDYWKPNLEQYMALPVRNRAAQQAALAVFDYGWSMILQGCGDPALGDAGKRCISERQRGGIYDGFTPYRDPIANDPGVVDNPVASAGDSILSAVGLNPTAQVGGVDVDKLILPGLLIGLALVL